MNKFIRQQATRNQPTVQQQLDLSEAEFHITPEPVDTGKTWAEQRTDNVRLANIALLCAVITVVVVWAIALSS